MDLPTYTSIWRIEKRLYKLYDFRLPMPLPIGQVTVFTAVAVPYVVLLTMLGLPFNHTLIWLYVLPPGLATWLATRPVLESKRLPELIKSQLRYLAEPRVLCRMAPLSERDVVVVSGRVWRPRASRRAEKTVAAEAMASASSVEALSSEAAAVSGAPARARRRPLGLGRSRVLAREAQASPGNPGALPAWVASGPVGRPAAPPSAWAPGPLPSPPPGRSARPAGPAQDRPVPASPAPAPPAAAAVQQPRPAAPGQVARPVPARPAAEQRPHDPASGSAVPEPRIAGPADRPEHVAPEFAARAAVASEPVSAEPVAPEFAAPELFAPEPVAPEPTVSEPVRREPAAPEPAAPEPAAPEPAAPGPTAGPQRPAITVVSAGPARATPPAVERALAGPSARRGDVRAGRVSVVPGGHRPGKPDLLQRDRARAQLPIGAPARIVVLGCTVGAGQTMTALLTGEVLASLRADKIAVLDLNPGSSSLARRAESRPALSQAASLGPSRLIVIVPPRPGGAGHGSAGHGGAAGQAASRRDPAADALAFSAAGDRHELVLADPPTAAVPRLLAIADQLVLVAPASAAAPGAIAMTFEWLEAHGQAGLAAGAVMVLNGVSRRSTAFVEQAERVCAGRCRAIVRVPWDDQIQSHSTKWTHPAAPGSQARQHWAGLLSPATAAAYTALAGVLVASLADRGAGRGREHQAAQVGQVPR
ncbi:MAG TPA: TcpE family conjugal transfer membrane protein [Streptosporangiaceae bacterium]|nr:TcpE family conjugal transfer membrane protein [Streptosporangiaceae bacterium]